MWLVSDLTLAGRIDEAPTAQLSPGQKPGLFFAVTICNALTFRSRRVPVGHHAIVVHRAINGALCNAVSHIYGTACRIGIFLALVAVLVEVSLRCPCLVPNGW